MSQRVLRGRAATLQDDRTALQAFVETTPQTETVGVRVWQPHPHVAFGRRDANRNGYDTARELARDQGYQLRERAVGGHAVLFTGTTVAFAYVEPVEDSRSGIQDRYDRITARIQDGLNALGVDTYEGEPANSFCPGTHSLSGSGKIVGLAQRVHSDVAVVSGIVVVGDHEKIASVLDPLYTALSLQFEKDSVGSIARAGGDTEPDIVQQTLETHLLDTADPRAVSVEQFQ